MKNITKTWLGFIVALTALNVTKPAEAYQKPVPDLSNTTLESRLSRISATLRQREQQLPDLSTVDPPDTEVASWLRGRRGGWVNGGRGSFLNRRRWSDRGGFLNRGGGGFLNRR